MRAGHRKPGEAAGMLNTSGFTIERACVEYHHLRRRMRDEG
jgi:hypothetical protein